LGVQLLAKLEGIEPNDEAAFGDMLRFTMHRGIVERVKSAGMDWPPKADAFAFADAFALAESVQAPAEPEAPAAGQAPGRLSDGTPAGRGARLRTCRDCGRLHRRLRLRVVLNRVQQQ
jgi:hypothetical protein